MVMEPQAPGPVTSNSSTSKSVPDSRMNQLPPLDNSPMAIQSSSMAVSSAPQSKPVDTDPATGTPVKPNSHTLGYEFVRQYYTMLNKAPGSVHRFYAEDSSFIHGSLNDSIQSEPVYGQHKIYERITALNFKDCHAKIVRVDSLGTVGDGFVIQVTGELSNDGEPMRRFFQTFVLVPRGPNNYYVRNDIFRYQDEVFADEEEVSEAEETEVTRPSAPVATSNPTAETIAPVPSSNPSVASSAVATALPAAPAAAPPATVPVATDPAPSHISSDSAAKLPREETRATNEKASASSPSSSSSPPSIVDKSPKGSVKVNGYQEQKSPVATQVSSEQKQQQSPSVGPSQQKSNKSSSQVASGNNNTSVTPVTNSSTVVSSSSSVVQSEKTTVSWAAKVARDTMKPSSAAASAIAGAAAPVSSDVTSNSSVTHTLLPSPKASKEQSQQTHNTSPAGQQQPQQHQSHSHPQQHQQAQQQQPHQHNQQQQPLNQQPQQQQQQQNAHHPQQQQSGRKGGDRVAKTPKVDKDESNALHDGDPVGNENNHEVIKKISPYNDEQQVFVGNLPLDIKEEDLKVFFSKFGNILDVRINRTNQTSGSGRTPNYGFVTFDDAKVVRNILSQKPIYFNEHRFNVEEKRSQGRGSALNRSASGATLGVNKGANQQHNQQQNSHQARRERRDRFPFQGNREAGPRRNQTAGASSGAPVMAGQSRPVFQPKR